MRNLPVRKPINDYTLPNRRYDGENKLVKRTVQGLVVIGAFYIGLQIVSSVFGFVLSAAGFILPVGVLGVAAYGAWQWMRSK